LPRGAPRRPAGREHHAPSLVTADTEGRDGSGPRAAAGLTACLAGVTVRAGVFAPAPAPDDDVPGRLLMVRL